MAALGAQDGGRLAGEGAESDLALDALGDVARERGLAGAGIAEEAEELRLAALEPGGDGRQRILLLRRPGRHRPRASARRFHRMPEMMMALPANTKGSRASP